MTFDHWPDSDAPTMAIERGRSKGSAVRNGPGSAIGAHDMAGDDAAHHLAGPLGDAEAALLAPHALDRQVGGETDAAVNLHAAIDGGERHLVGKVLAVERL